MTHTDIINRVAKAIGAETYLEIGVRTPADNYDLIEVEQKTGVDPALDDPDRNILQLTSAAFFVAAKRGNGMECDLIFIDGDHSYPQVLWDVRQALFHMALCGATIVHDVNPLSPWKATPVKPSPSASWSGECWRAFVKARSMPTVRGCCISDDHGIGILMNGPVGPEITLPEHYEWPELDANRQDWLNIIDPGHLEHWITTGSAY